MKLTFIGAAHEVTGSCTLLEACGKKILIDCGMEQGEDIYENCELPISPADVDAICLTHAHIDHSGLIPAMTAKGFSGPIYATEAARQLCKIMLLDSAHIQESEAEWRNRKAQRAGEDPYVPLYTAADAMQAVSLFHPYDYGHPAAIFDGITICFSDAGHLLGSASILFTITENGETRTILFSGDLGNIDRPLIRDPQKPPYADYVVIESTYGDRVHGVRPDYVSQLTEILQETLDRGGNLVIPSFAIGRTQEMLYAIREIKQNGLVRGHEGFPVYVDSPLAVEATAVFLQCDLNCLDEQTTALVRQGINPLWFDGLCLSVTPEDSKLINENHQPKVILSASGMCEAGRIRHHLKHNLWRQESMILFVGYQAENSLGRRLQDGAKTVRLFGEDIAVHAEIASLHGTSGHADRDGLVNWLQGFREKPRTVYVNHGDDDACKSFQELLTGMGYHAEAPYSGTEYDLLTDRMTVYTESKPISREQIMKGTARAQAVYADLLAAAEELLALVKGRRGRTNKENAKLTSQIRNLIEKWKD